MADNDEQLQINTYVWSQSNDQVTISFLVPETAKAKDLDITIERQYLKAGLKGEEPVIQVIKKNQRCPKKSNKKRLIFSI